MKNHKEITKIVLIYALFGCVWIFFSDTLLNWCFKNADIITEFSIIKGFLFIVATSILLYFLISHLSGKIVKSTSALQESEELLQFLVKYSSDTLVIVDADGCQRYVSPGAEKIFGYLEQELEGKTIDDLIHPDDLQSIKDAWKMVIEHPEKTVTVQYRHIHKVKDWIFVEAVAQSFLHDPAIKGVIASVRDITKRKLAEEEIKENEARYLALFNNINSAVSIYRAVDNGKDFVLVNINDAGRRINHIDNKEAIGKRLTELFPNIKTVGLVAVCQQVYHSGMSIDVPEHKYKDEYRDGWRKTFVYKLPTGEIVIISDDITKRKDAENSLRESEERNRLLSDLTMEGVVIHKNGVAIDLNTSMAKMLGLDRTELLNKNVMNYIDERDHDLIRENIAKEYAPPYIVRMLRSNGESFFAEIESRNFQKQDERWRVSAVRDITERMRAERQLIESHELLENLARLVPGVIYQYRLYPDGRSAFPYSSPGMNDIYEVSPEDIQKDATPVFGRLHPEDHDRVAKAIHESARTLKTFYCEFRVILPRQGLRWRWSQAEPQRMADNSILWHGIILDITDRKRVEQETEKLHEQLSQAQKMESVGRLAGGVAHDFNNMLGVILGYSEMALMNVEADQSLHSALRGIQQAAQRSAGLTKQLLAFARKQTVSPKILDVNATVESMLKMLKRLIGEDIELEWLPGKELRTIKLDPSQLDQILANLCVNSRDAIKDTGKITIETSNAFIGETDIAAHPYFIPGKYVLLTVRDNGCGMDHKTLSHLFEPFFTTKEIGVGTGLGLATIYGVIKQNKGFITVDSKLGQGTSFKIYLPCYNAQHDHKQKPNDTEPNKCGHETILLVEDEPMILEMTTKMLQGLGYNILSASTPDEAVRLAQEHAGEINLLMTDVVMPGRNGRELAKNLSSLYPDLKVIFMSGYTANVIEHHGVLDQGVNFIQKPFTMNDLSAKIREIFVQ